MWAALAGDWGVAISAGVMWLFVGGPLAIALWPRRSASLGSLRKTARRRRRVQ